MIAPFTVEPAAAFRGHRDYYHSTDLYEALLAGLQAQGIEATAFDLRIQERITGQPRIEFSAGQPSAAGERAAASARFETAAGPWFARVLSGSPPIAQRKAYDEAPTWQRTRREGDRAFIAENVRDAAPIEVVTAVAVHAHRQLLPPPPGSRWLLAQITGSRLLGPAESDYFRFEIVRQVGKGMTQSTMADRHGTFGKMLFILK